MTNRFQSVTGRRPAPFVFVPPTVRQVKLLIWVYFWLIIIEGSLRKWVVPALSDPLLVIRDPVVLLIYLQAIRGNFFPKHWLVKVTIALGVFTFFWGLMHAFVGGSMTMAVVVAYGVRTYFLHLPLIFIIGHVFTRDDVLKMGRWCLYLAVPIGMLMVAQYRVDSGHWLNKGTLGEESRQLTAAMGKIRPPGPFAFITGPAIFYPLVVAFLIFGVMRARTYPLWLMIAAAGTTVLVWPVSGSRSLVIGCAVVIVFAMVVLLRMPKLVPRFAVWIAVFVFGGIAMLTLPVGREAIESFNTRWQQAADSEGQGEGAKAGITRRVGGNFLEVFEYLDQVPITGYGIGAGTNVGVKLLTGGVGFLYGEVEWTRNVMEAGPILGFAYIGFRCVFAGFLIIGAWRKLTAGDALPWLLMSCAAVHLVVGQTTQPTILGFMALISGLSLSAVGTMQRGAALTENQRRFIQQRARTHSRGPNTRPE